LGRESTVVFEVMLLPVHAGVKVRGTLKANGHQCNLSYKYNCGVWGT
jgi:hypothetical protein